MTIKIAWVTRSFLDYRIPVIRELSKLVDDNLFLIYSGDYVPESVQDKAKEILGERCIPMYGEWKFGREDQYFMANKNISVRFQPGLLKKIKEVDPDIIVCDGFFKWTFSALMYKLSHRTPIVINYERTHHTERNVQWFRTLYRKLVVKLTDAMDCSGRLCVEYTKSLGMPGRDITTGHMVADTQGISERVASISTREITTLRQDLSVNGVVFIYVGRLHTRKGVVELVNAWSEFERSSSNEATLVLVGGGEQREQLKNLCREKGIGSVRFAGQVAYDDIAAFYAMSDVFVIPTLEDNWSLVVPEAMSAGLPILCSKYNGCWPELVKEGINGWVFDPLDKDQAIEKLRVATDPKTQLNQKGKMSTELLRKFTPMTAAASIRDACDIAVNRRLRNK